MIAVVLLVVVGKKLVYFSEWDSGQKGEKRQRDMRRYSAASSAALRTDSPARRRPQSSRLASQTVQLNAALVPPFSSAIRTGRVAPPSENYDTPQAVSGAFQSDVPERLFALLNKIGPHAQHVPRTLSPDVGRATDSQHASLPQYDFKNAVSLRKSVQARIAMLRVDHSSGRGALWSTFDTACKNVVKARQSRFERQLLARSMSDGASLVPKPPEERIARARARRNDLRTQQVFNSRNTVVVPRSAGNPQDPVIPRRWMVIVVLGLATLRSLPSRFCVKSTKPSTEPPLQGPSTAMLGEQLTSAAHHSTASRPADPLASSCSNIRRFLNLRRNIHIAVAAIRHYKWRVTLCQRAVRAWEAARRSRVLEWYEMWKSSPFGQAGRAVVIPFDDVMSALRELQNKKTAQFIHEFREYKRNLLEHISLLKGRIARDLSMSQPQLQASLGAQPSPPQLAVVVAAQELDQWIWQCCVSKVWKAAETKLPPAMRRAEEGEDRLLDSLSHVSRRSRVTLAINPASNKSMVRSRATATFRPSSPVSNPSFTSCFGVD